MNNRITMHWSKPTKVTKLYDDRYTFTKWKWLERLLIKYNVIKRDTYEEVSYERISIDGDDLVDKIWKTQRHVFQGHRPKKIYLGPDEFQDLLGHPRIYEFATSLSFQVEMREGRFNVFDVPVEVVPHMSGILVV